ncbi:DUF2515 domain-containing protein [Paenibacillus sp. YYML68]|uniref:DUF2515 domain-containing protein n=1 Tax=Paenibacillus sp. YYML68 TaxID=2909250 RepID=UPI002491BE37|nr:DUF2515 domain-containing protein [Paenibacillus sp. YYML68]
MVKNKESVSGTPAWGRWRRLLRVPRRMWATIGVMCRASLQVLTSAVQSVQQPEAEQPTARAAMLELKQASVQTLRARCSWRLGLSTEAVSTVHTAPVALTGEERQWVERIRLERDRCNRNNVTRTAAYLRLYQKRPELHWAFLAHMVSRNGGWSMTDLRGELVPFLLDEDQRRWVFSFLERANALIFRDAYPQLLLYDASKVCGRPLFHLLPLFGVSRFMLPVWELFWLEQQSALLTVGLITNEQHYIEERVVRNPAYLHNVIDTLFFQAQSLLQLNQVLFPYADQDGGLKLAGVTVDHFSSVHARIEVGKKLYAILFGLPEVYEGARRFAFAHRHTGSRADMLPQLFSAVRQDAPPTRGQLEEKLDSMDELRLKPGKGRLYSPSLADVWADRPVATPEGSDWFRDLSVLDRMCSIEVPTSFEMTTEYGRSLKKIELAVLANGLLD